MKSLYNLIILITATVLYCILNLWIVATGWNMMSDIFPALPHINMMHVFSVWCFVMLIRPLHKPESMKLGEYLRTIAGNGLTRLAYLGILYLALLNTGAL